ncbi:TIR domain-containing protein [Paraburkholderia tropica]|uniref:TIR domain-containing protein n=1 Tax=Paraburkholderia tropica TaxID=92647 RepID=UPI0016001782|nr:TIR domain-containing protein [Paraburkholderia tropica]QNB12618.1 TIR domain-containing protein [Paraburkholderia tropica]
MARKCFFSFHYKPDSVRAARVRNIGVIEGNEPAKDNDWEKVVGGGDKAIENWISDQMEGKTCLVLLVGEKTANRKWINHEIIKAWNDGLGVVAIRIHGLVNFDGDTALQGANPLEFITLANGTKKLSEVAKCYNPSGADSKARYNWIADHIGAMVEEAITIRKNYK